MMLADKFEFVNFLANIVVYYWHNLILWIFDNFSLVKPIKSFEHIFGFAEFISALAILLVLFTLTDIRYRFRVSIARIPFLPKCSIHKFSFWLFVLLGFFILITDLWYGSNWYVPRFIANPLWLQTVSILLFSVPIFLWMYWAFIKPPIFNEKNSKRFYERIYDIILRGSEDELSIVANELVQSVHEVVKLSNLLPDKFSRENSESKKADRKITSADYAYHLLFLIRNRKFCRYIVSVTPVTAIAFFSEMTEQKKYRLPMGQFGINILTEALINRDSIFYHEDDGIESGLIGHFKSFGRSMFSDYDLVETLASEGKSPLDVGHRLFRKWEACQLKIYCSCVLIFAEAYFSKLSQTNHMQPSFAFSRAVNIIESSCDDLYKIENLPETYEADSLDRLEVCVDFVEKVVALLGKQPNLPEVPLRERATMNKDIYSYISDLMFEIIFSASAVTKSPDRCWYIHYNVVFSNFLRMFRTKTADKPVKIICHRLRRKLFDEIKQLDEFPNYKSARILGYCLNVLGFSSPKEGNYHYAYALKKVVLSWVKNNYLKLRCDNPDVADACLMGGISFDAENNRLVRTLNSMRKEGRKVFFDLNIDTHTKLSDD